MSFRIVPMYRAGSPPVHPASEKEQDELRKAGYSFVYRKESWPKCAYHATKGEMGVQEHEWPTLEAKGWSLTPIEATVDKKRVAGQQGIALTGNTGSPALEQWRAEVTETISMLQERVDTLELEAVRRQEEDELLASAPVEPGRPKAETRKDRLARLTREAEAREAEKAARRMGSVKNADAQFDAMLAGAAQAQ